MADTIQFDLVSPERRLVQVEATQVQVPGADGDLTAMANHAPTVTSLRPGVLTVTHGGTDEAFVVSGGFAEISPTSVSVLAERAVKQAEMDQASFDSFVSEAEARLAKARDAKDADAGVVDDAVKLLADMVAVGSEIGLSPSKTSV